MAYKSRMFRSFVSSNPEYRKDIMVYKTWNLEGENTYRPLSDSTKYTYKLMQKDPTRAPTPEEFLEWSKIHDNGGTARYDSWHIHTMGVYGEREIVPPSEGQGVVLPSGLFEVGEDNKGDYLSKTTCRHERTVSLGAIQDRIELDIHQFLTSRALYDEHGSTYKRGYLLYGPPGNGKSCLLRTLITEKFQDAIVVYMARVPSSTLLRRLAEDDRVKVFVIEELTEAVEGKRLSEFLGFLDGEKTVEKAIYIATTNYSGSLPKNLVSRPGRFDLLIKFDDPDPHIRKRLLEDLNIEVTKPLLQATEGFSISAIHEIVRRSKLQGITLKSAIKEFQDQEEQASKDFGDSQKERSGFGFSSRPYPVDDIFDDDD